MATFNTYVKLGALRGNSLLSFNLSGCTTNNKNSCTALPDYQNVLFTQFSGSGLYVTGLTLHSTYYIYIEADRKVSGSNCNVSLTNEMVSITGIPTPTPTPTNTPTPTPTPTPLPPTNTPTNTPNPCSFDANVVYGLPATNTPLPATNTPLPATNTPLPATNTPLPATVTPQPPTNTPLPATVTPSPPTATPIPCVTSASFEVVSGGQIRYVDCCGVTEYVNVGAGPEVINVCIENGSVYALSATIGTVTYGTTPCTCPATPTPLPATVTPLPPTNTPFQTTFSGYVSLVNGPSACSGGEYSNVNITVQGTSLCNFTKVLGLSSTTYGNVYGDMTNNTTFYITDGTDHREILRDGSAETGTAQTACTSCSNPATPEPPSPTPTPESYYDYVRCTGPTSGVSPIYSVAISSGSGAPAGIIIEGNCFSPLNSIQYTSPANYEIKTYTGTGCACD